MITRPASTARLRGLFTQPMNLVSAPRHLFCLNTDSQISSRIFLQEVRAWLCQTWSAGAPVIPIWNQRWKLKPSGGQVMPVSLSLVGQPGCLVALTRPGPVRQGR